jgi:hypothetical protein
MTSGRGHEMTLDLSRAEWQTSTRSAGNGDCVEVAPVDLTTDLRPQDDR